MSSPAAVAAELKQILDDLSGSVKTKQIAALQRLVPILKDQNEILAQVLRGNSSDANENDAKHGKSLTWDQLLSTYCQFVSDCIAKSVDKKSNFFTQTVNPALDGLKKLSDSIEWHQGRSGLLFKAEGVEEALKLITSTAALMQKHNIQTPFIQLIEAVLCKTTAQSAVGHPREFRAATRSLLAVLTTQEMSQGGFHRICRLFRLIVTSNSAASFVRLPAFVSEFVGALTRVLEHASADQPAAREMLIALNYFLKGYLYNDVAGLATTILAQLNDLLAGLLAECKKFDLLSQEIVLCFRLQMRIYVQLDGALIDIPCFDRIASAVQRAQLNLAPPPAPMGRISSSRHAFSTDPRDKYFRMESNAFRFADLSCDVIYRMHSAEMPSYRAQSTPSLVRSEKVYSSPKDADGAVQQPANKRRKVADSALDALVTGLETASNEDIFSWLRVLVVLLSKYPRLLSLEQQMKLLATLKDRCLKAVDRIETEVHILFCLGKLVELHIDSKSLADTLLPIFETIFSKINQSKPESQVLEAALRVCINMLETLPTSILAPVVNSLHHFIWKFKIFTEPSISVCSSLAARLAFSTARRFGFKDDSSHSRRESLCLWALQSVAKFIETAQGDELVPLSSVHVFCENLLPFLIMGVISNGMHVIPDFVDFLPHADQDEADLWSIEKARFLSYNLSPRERMGSKPTGLDSASYGGPLLLNQASADNLLAWADRIVSECAQQTEKSHPVLSRFITTLSLILASVNQGENQAPQLREARNILRRAIGLRIPPANSGDFISNFELHAWTGPLSNSEIYAELERFIISRIQEHLKVATTQRRPSSSGASAVIQKASAVSSVPIDDEFDDELDGSPHQRRQSSGSNLGTAGSSSSSDASSSGSDSSWRHHVSLLTLCLTMSNKLTSAIKDLLVSLLTSSPTIDAGGAISCLLASLSNCCINLRETTKDVSNIIVRVLERYHLHKSALALKRLRASSRHELVELLTISLHKQCTEMAPFATSCAENMLTLLQELVLASNQHQERKALMELVILLFSKHYTGDDDRFGPLLMGCAVSDFDLIMAPTLVSGISVLFQAYEQHEGLWEDAKKGLKEATTSAPNKASVEFHATRQRLLSHVAAAISPELEIDVLMVIFENHINMALVEHDAYSQLALDGCARQLGHSNTCEWLKEQIWLILYRSATHLQQDKEHRVLERFPWSILGLQDSSEFIQRFAADIAVFVALTGDNTSLAVVSNVLGLEAGQLIRQNFAYCCGKLLPLALDKAHPLCKEANQSISKFLFDKKWWPQKQGESKDPISVSLIGDLGICSDAILATHSASQDVILSCFGWLFQKAKVPKANSFAELLIQEPRALHHLVLRISNRFASKGRASCRQRTVSNFEFFIKRVLSLDNLKASAFLCPPIIFTLIRFLKSKENCISLLGNVISTALSSQLSAQALSGLLPFILGDLLSIEPIPSQIIVRILNSDFVSKELQSLFPLPQHPDLQALRDAQQQQQQHHKGGPTLRLLRLVEFAHSGLVPQCSRVECLRQALELIRKDPSVASRDTQLLSKLATRLFEICKGNSDPSSRELAIKCLAVLNLHSFPALLDSPSVADPMDKVLVGSSDMVENPYIVIHCQVLQRLLRLMLSPDVALATAATEAVEVILSGMNKDQISHIGQKMNSSFSFLFRMSCEIFHTPTPRAIVPAAWDSKIISWEAGSKESHQQWVQRVTSALCSSSKTQLFLRACSQVCLLEQSFSELLFPYAFTDACESNPIHMSSSLNSHVLTHLENIPRGVLRHIVQGVNTARVTAILRKKRSFVDFSSVVGEAIASLKPKNSFPPPSLVAGVLSQRNAENLWDENEFWPRIDFDKLADLALRGGSALSSLQFLEMHEKRLNKFDQSLAPMLVDIYEKINEIDSSEGLNSLVGNSSTKLQAMLYVQHAKWQSAISLYGLSLQSELDHTNRVEFYHQLLSALQSSGQLHLADSYLRGLVAAEPDLESNLADYRYDLAWRLMQWDQIHSPTAPHRSDAPSAPFALWNSLSALQRKDMTIVQHCAAKVKESLAIKIGSLDIESTSELRPILAHWTCFEDIVDESPIEEQLANWKLVLSRMMQNGEPFENFEPLLNARDILTQLKQAHIYLSIKLSCEFVAMARQSGTYQVSATALSRMQRRLDAIRTIDGPLHAILEIPCRLEAANLKWETGEKIAAIQQAKSLVETRESRFFRQVYQKLKGDPKHRKLFQDLNDALARIHANLGEWLAETRMERTPTIQEHLKKATEYFAETPDSSRGHFDYAKIFDARLVALQEASRSVEAEALRQVKAKRKKELESAAAVLADPHATMELKSRAKKLQDRVLQDDAETAALEKEQRDMVESAFHSWLTLLCRTDDRKLILHAVFRVIALWFDTYKYRTDLSMKITQELKKGSIPLDRFLPLFYQIASRLSNSQLASCGNEASHFQTALQILIAEMVRKHPHHTVPVLFSLSRNDKVMDSHAKGYTVDRDKMAAAQNILNTVTGATLSAKPQQVDGTLKETIDETFRVYDALVDLAFLNAAETQAQVDRHNSQRVIRKIPANFNILSFQNTKVAVPTCPYISPEQELPTIWRYEPYFELVGGITAPKALYCHGSDGKIYKQLLKGPNYVSNQPPDDLRQDAVMEQAFGLINSLLAFEPESRKRQLRMRTYRVVPLTPAAGILEWVPNTSPIMDYLVGKPPEHNGAHSRYHPKEPFHSEIRDDFRASVGGKSKCFESICKQFTPVFHNYFLENYQNPVEWFSRRLTYSRSLATSSMVGYVIGLGDRHLNNIMMDAQTAEVVHIDLGIAFEQGKQLPVPEIVPFRLTRDLVSGLGITGVNGVFTETCERSMEVMRRQHQFIENIVSVFLHDPLFRWNVLSSRAQRLQREDDSEADLSVVAMSATASADAASTLLRVKHKLSGAEYGDVLSVQGQVRQLIEEATDPENLCKMFYGWAPWV